MKILSINCTQPNRQNSFKAKFPKQHINEFLREVKDCDVDTIPQLYTMLDFIKNQSGKKAEIEHINLWHRILIDGKSVTEDNKYFNAFHALKEATVKTKTTLVKNSPIKRMSEEEFENAYYQNSNKTVQDIENLFE